MRHAHPSNEARCGSPARIPVARRARGAPKGLALLAALLLLPSPVRAALPPEDDAWIRADSPNFTLFSDAGPKKTTEIARRLEVFREMLWRFNDRLRFTAPVPTLIYVFRNDDAFDPYKGIYKGKPSNEAAFFAPSPDANYIAMNGGLKEDLPRVVYHEYTHFFIDNNLRGLPVWFQEGIADCYGGFGFDGKLATVGRPDPWMVELLRRYTLMPLKTLFAVTRQSPEYNEEERQGLFYAESWGLVHYVLWDNPKRRPQMAAFLEALAAGGDPETAFTTSFNITLQKFEGELKNHFLRGHFVFPAVPAQGPPETAVRIAPLPRAEALYHLADLLIHVHGDRREAIGEFAGAVLALDPSHSGIRASLGLWHHQLGEADEAIALLEKALALDPKNWLASFYLGDLLARRYLTSEFSTRGSGSADDRQRARDALSRAIELQPDFMEPYFDYGSTYLFEDAPVNAGIAMLEGARLAMPSRSDVVRNLAYLYLKKGERAKAEDLLVHALARMGDRQAAQDVRAALAAPPGPDGRFVIPRPGPDLNLLQNLKQILATTTDPEIRKSVALEIEALENGDDYNALVATYNQAVAAANLGNFKEAIAALEALLPRARDPELAGRCRELIDRIRKDAARLGKPLD